MLVQSHLTFSQSYPIARIEGKDTLVVMTRSQATAMNDKFIKLKNERDSMKVDYNSMRAISDSLATDIVRIQFRLQKAESSMALLNERALKLKKEQANELFARTLFLGWVSFVMTIAQF